MNMKLRGHETFFIRKGWLTKGMKYVSRYPDVFTAKESDRKPMDVLGIGSNMVLSLRYWLQVVGLTEETKGEKGRRVQNFTPFGELVFKNDKYIEEIGTLYLLHYKLASNFENATSWFYFFNRLKLSEFTEDDFFTGLSKFLAENGYDKEVSKRLVSDDFSCIVSTYISKSKSSNSELSAEDNIDCPLGELNLVDAVSKKKGVITYKKSVPSAKSFDPYIILAAINGKRQEDEKSGKNAALEIPLNTLMTDDNSIGKIFNLEAIALLDVLHSVEKTGELKIIRTAGLDVIRLEHDYSFDECVQKYYEHLNERE